MIAGDAHDLIEDKGELFIVREVETLKREYESEPLASATLRLGGRTRRFVQHLVSRLKTYRRSDHILRSTALWALCMVLSADPDTREHMLNLGLAGLLVQMLQHDPAGADNHYTRELSQLLSGAVLTFKPTDLEQSTTSTHLSAASSAELVDPFVPYSLSEGNKQHVRELFPLKSGALLDRRSRQSRSLMTHHEAGGVASPRKTRAAARRVYGRQLPPQRRLGAVRGEDAVRQGTTGRRRGGVTSLTIPAHLLPPVAAATSSPRSHNINELLPHALDPLFQRVAAGDVVEARLAAEGVGGEARVRIPALALAGSDFMRRFFVGRGGLVDAQSLLQRLQTVLSIVDREATGFVTWTHFADIILSLAPPHLVRSNVIRFLEAQSDSPTSLIDYNEFVISGKVLILDEFCHKREVVNTSGWIERQKLQGAAGGRLLSWKGHVEWFTKRRTVAVIWLMRAANAGLFQSTRTDLAFAFLVRRARLASAYTFLLQAAWSAQEFDRQRLEAERFLIKRSLRGRRSLVAAEAAFTFLREMGREVLRLERVFGDKRLNKKELIAALRAKAQGVKKEAVVSVSAVYKIYNLQKFALDFLRAKAKFALSHSRRQDECYEALWSQSAARIRTSAKIQRVFEELRSLAERARAFTARQDIAWGGLTLWGERALRVEELQTRAVAWMQQRADRAEITTRKRQAAFDFLQSRGSHRLRVFASCTYLQRRVNNAILLLYSQEVAVAFLRARVPRAYVHLAAQREAQDWLARLGPHAIRYTNSILRHAQELQIIGRAALDCQKRKATALFDLRVVGRIARLEVFRQGWGVAGENRERLADECLRLQAREVRLARERAQWSAEDRDRAYLLSACQWLADISQPNDSIETDSPPEMLISRVAFQRLFGHGKVSAEHLDDAFTSLNTDNCGLLDFETVWLWYWTQGTADQFSLEFSFAGVVPVPVQAAAVLLRRFVLKQ